MTASLTELSSADATVKYLTVAHYEAEGYYAKNDPRHRRASFWHGKGAAALGLPQHVSPRLFERVLAGYVPGTEIRLGRVRDGEHQHRPGLDLTLSAPKSVSLEALLYGNRRVLGAHDAAARSTLDWIEADLLQTRDYDPATGRRPRVAADGLVAAGVRHLTSRNQDPQLHTHCILANMTRNRAGEWRSVEPTEIRRNVKLIGAYYRQELARRLIALGFRIETTMIGGVPGFEIAGYPREMLDTFSTRRREILAWLDAHGLPYSAALTQQAALITRKHKVDKDVDTLKAEWKARAAGIAHDRSLSRQGRAQDRRQSRQTSKGRPYVRTEQELRPESPGLSVREVVWRAVEHLAERASVFRESDIRAIALSHAPGRHELGEIDAAVTGLLADGHLVEARVRSGRSFVTADALRSEREIMSRMRDGIGAAEALTEEARVSEHLDGTILTEGQREAVRIILLSHDRIVAVQGVAGAGKTTMLREVLHLIGERKAILLAPSAAAARVLADETGARVRTVQWFLTRYGDLGNEGKMAIARREHEGSVLVLDESSMTSTAQMRLLMRISERLRVARLVLVGDRGQLRAVGAGEPFRALQDAGIAMAEMDEILRQRDPGLKRAVKALQQGRSAEAVRGFDEVREVPHEELGAEAARLWLALDEEQRAETAILAPTHFIRAEIHRVVRERLAREGVLHGRELEIERYVNRHLTAAQRADVRHHEQGDFVIFHSRVPPLRVDEGDACRIARAEDGFVFLDHPSGRTVRIQPGDGWVRYRFGIYETARIRIRAGDRVRWTRNDKRHDLLNGGEAVVLGIDSRRVRFDLGGEKTLSLARDDPQLRHIDHAWSTTVQAAQGMTRDGAIGVLDTGHGRLTGQAGLYVEASRARDRFVLVTDNRETLEEALEDNDGARLTAREAVGETDLPAQPPDAATRMLRDLRDDWRALVARAEAETTELNRMEGYARIVTGVQALVADLDLPPEMQAFVDEVRQRDARMVEGRRDELAFLQKTEAHCHRHPLLKWAAEERGLPVSDLPEHAAWLAEGAALEETGRRMQERPGFVGRITAALGRIAQGFRLDEGERFREAAARHEAEAQRLGIDPGSMAGAARLVQRAETLGHHELPEAVRRRVDAWTPERDSPAPARGHRPPPGHEEARRRIEAFLRDCRHCLDAPPPAAETLDQRIDTAEALRREGLRLLGEGEGAKLDDPARIRLSRAADERERVHEAVDALGAEVQGLRSQAFVELSLSVAPYGLEAHPDPVDLPAWGALRDRAEALRGEAGLAPDAREAVDAVLARDARVEAEIAPVRAFLEGGALHLERRAALDEGVRGLDPPSPDAIPAWRERSQNLRDTALNLLGGSPADTRETQAAARLADMPRLQGRVREVLDRLETLELRDEVADFRKLAATVERRARRQETLPLFAEGYDRATEMAQSLTSRAALPEAAGHEAAAWLDRDRGWKEELASAQKLTEAQEQDVDRAGLRKTLSEALPEAFREATRLPAVRAAIGQETARLAQSPSLRQGISWTGAAPLVAGDHIAWRAGGTVHHAVVAFPGETGGMRASDTLLLRIAGRADGTALDDADRIVEIGAQALWDGGCARAAWSNEGLRQLEAARQYSVPGAACRLACSEPVEGDRIAWTEAAGRTGEVRTIEAVVATRTETPDGHEIALRTIRASGPGAPEPGGSIRRTADEVTARGCFRAPWSDEARRERILDPPKEVQERTLTQRRERSRGGGIGM